MSADKETITLPFQKFKQFYIGCLRYRALEYGGVDNWDWYEDSIEDFLKECYFTEFPNKTEKDFYNEDYDFSDVFDYDFKNRAFLKG